VSSNYRILCLSHDPAIVAGDFTSAEAAEAEIAVGLNEHPQCDLLIGRYSYPLVEVGCPPTTGIKRSGQHYCFPHAMTKWVDVAWLRLLAAAHQSGNDQMRALVDDTHLRHWPWGRLQRLRDELGLAVPQRADA
jgi:hypothetical protein